MRSHFQRLVQEPPKNPCRPYSPWPFRTPIPRNAACNLDKSATLPAREHVDRALARTAVDLGDIAESARLPVLLDRTRGAAIGIYQSLPAGTPLWLGRRQYLPN